MGSAAVYDVLRPIALAGKHATVKVAGAAITAVLEWARISEFRAEGSPVETVRRRLPDNPVYAFCPEHAPPDGPQQIRIVFQSIPGYVPTALVALTLVDAERLCSKLNARLGLDRDAWMKLAAQAMRDPGPTHNSSIH